MAIPSGWPIEVGEAIILNISTKGGEGGGRWLTEGWLLFKETQYLQ